MRRSVRYHPDFDGDIIGAAEWYANRRRELGLDFTHKVERAVANVISDPEQRNTVDYGIRYWPVERFPYVVFFDLTDTEIILLGVMHTSQQPDKWIARKG